MSEVAITSRGACNHTQVELDGVQIPAERILACQLASEPGIEQVTCQLRYLDADGVLTDWHGVNPDDCFVFELSYPTGGQGYEYLVRSDGRQLCLYLRHKLGAPGSEIRIFPEAALVVSLLGGGWQIQLSKLFELPVRNGANT